MGKRQRSDEEKKEREKRERDAEQIMIKGKERKEETES